MLAGYVIHSNGHACIGKILYITMPAKCVHVGRVMPAKCVHGGRVMSYKVTVMTAYVRYIDSEEAGSYMCTCWHSYVINSSSQSGVAKHSSSPQNILFIGRCCIFFMSRNIKFCCKIFLLDLYDKIFATYRYYICKLLMSLTE